MLRKDMEVAQKEVSRAKSELDLKDDEQNACTFYIWHQVIDWQEYAYTINFI